VPAIHVQLLDVGAKASPIGSPFNANSDIKA
jgi:hypothetical protein